MNNWLSRNGGKILSGISIFGVGATAVFAAKETPKAMKHLEDAKKIKGGPLTIKEKIKACWKDYLYTYIAAATTMVCIGSAEFLNEAQIVELTGSLVGVEGLLHAYRNHNARLNGEKSDEFIMKNIGNELDDEEKGLPPWDETCSFVIIFEDSFVEFEDTMQNVERAEHELDRKIYMEGKASVNDFMDLLHLDRVDGGDDLVWTHWVDFNNPAKEFGDVPYLVREVEMSHFPEPIAK